MMGANSRGLGADDARAPRPRRHGSRRDPGRDRRRRGRALSVGAAAGDPGRRRRACGGSRDELPVAIASSAHPDVIAAAVDALGVARRPAARSSPRTRCRTASRRRTCTSSRPTRLGVEPASVPRRRGLGQRRARPARPPGMFVVLVPNASVPPPPGTDRLADRSWSTGSPTSTSDALAGLITARRRQSLDCAPWPRPLTAGPVYRPFRVRFARLCSAVLVRSLVARPRSRAASDSRPDRRSTCPTTSTGPIRWSCWRCCRPAPKVAMFGPKEEDMRAGGRNRLIVWTGFSIPYRPEKSDMIETTRRVQRVLEDGWAIVIMGEGRIHRGERELLPLADGCAYFALRGRRAGRPDRDQRHELAGRRAARAGPRRGRRSRPRAGRTARRSTR